MSHKTSLIVAGLMALGMCACSVVGIELPTTVIKPVSTHLRARSRPDRHAEGMGVAGVRRIVPRPMVAARQQRSATTLDALITTDMPAGAAIDGQFIIIYKESVTDVRAAVAQSQAIATQVVTAASASMTSESTNLDPASLRVTVLSVDETPPGVPSHAVISVPGNVDVSAVKTALSASENVSGVVQNRIVATTQTGRKCYPASFAAGVQGTAAPGATFGWDGCLTDSTTKLGLFGERCGANSDKFRWTGIYAYNPSTNQMITSSSGACVRFRSAETDAARLQQFFGDCGVAPTYFPELPTTVCMEDGSSCADATSLANYAVSLSRPLCTSGSSSATFIGSACGPNNALVQWNKLSPNGCTAVSREGTDGKTQADWVGQCGVSPLQIAGLPTKVCGRSPGTGDNGPALTPPVAPAPQPSSVPPPASTQGALPRMPVKTGESMNWGVGRVGSYDPSKKTTLDVSAAVAATGYKVAVIDTGVDKQHPDINVVEFKDFVDAEGTTYYGKDGNGHGTHVAGIIAAKNNGAGVIGVVPNMPILALKVLPKTGSGPLDPIYSAYADVLARLLKGEKIVSINLSLSSVTDDPDAKKVECDWIQKLQSYGTAVCAAAGNDGEDLKDNLPADCVEALTVTSMDSADKPSYFSNFAAMDYEDKKKSLLTAPGSNIYSTYKDGGYATLSGTSMATPFVTGTAAACFLSGGCKLSSQPGVTNSQTTNYPVMLATAAAASCNNGKCGPLWGATNAYYGYYVNDRQF